jgi:8-oxo-dGTP pyrophosphatase MutT (NUDIX family)
MILKRNHEKCFNTAVICYCFMENEEILLLQKISDHKLYPGLWGIPGGKVDPGEDSVTAMVREIWEETGNKILRKNLKQVLETYHRHRALDGTPIYFRCLSFVLATRLTKLRLDRHEHQKHRTVELGKFQDLDGKSLIPDELEVFAMLKEIGAI